MGTKGSGDVVPLRTGAEGETHAYDTAPHAARDDLESFGHTTKVGRYIVLETVGSGGMGVVCTAYDPKLDRKVALKLLKKPAKPNARKTKTAQVRLIREAQALARLNHPNIVTVHDVDTFEGRIYMAMEYVEGRTLARWVEEKPRTWREILEAYDHAGRGLAAAHAAGLTHRDFKPANVLVGQDGRIRVLDFGLAKHIERDTSLLPDSEVDGDLEDEPEDDAPVPRQKSPSNELMEVVGSASRMKLTQAGRIVGTPAYMAPEQYRRGEVGPWTDQFGFAAAVYEALFGQLPFPGKYLDDVWYHIKNGLIRDPPRDSEVPTWVLRVLKRALHADPQQRYPSMEALLATLRADPAKRRRRIAAWSGAVPILGLGAYGAFMVLQPDQEPCQGARDRLEGVWDDGVRTEVGDALRATGTAYANDTAKRVLRALDAYADTWADDRTEVCEATRVHGEQSEALLDVRMTCLDQRRNELQALVNVLADADDKVTEHAVEAVNGLRTSAPCLTARPNANNALPSDPGQRAAVQAVQAKLDEAKALSAAGRYSEALVTAKEARAEAEAIGHPPTLARATFMTGQAHRQLGDLQDAERVLREAVLAAGRAGDTTTEAEAWVALVHLGGYSLNQPERGRAWALAAESVLERGAVENIRVNLLLNLGAVEANDNRFAEARSTLEEALNLASGDPDLASVKATILSNLGFISWQMGDKERAENELRQAHDLVIDAVGPDHPDVARIALALGNVLSRHETGYEEAEALYVRSLEIREQTYGSSSVEVANILNSLGALQRKRARLDEAEKAYRRALSIFERHDTTARFAAKTLNNLGILEMEQGHHEAALGRHERALRLVSQKMGDEHLEVAVAKQHLCRVLHAMGRLSESRQHCEAALAVLERTYEGPHPDIAETLVQLAEVELASGRRSAAAKVLARALDLHRELGSPPDTTQRIRSMAEGL